MREKLCGGLGQKIRSFFMKVKKILEPSTKAITVMLVPHSHGKVFTFKFSKRTLQFLTLGLVGTILGSLLFIVSLLDNARLSVKNRMLEEETKSQEEKIRDANMQFEEMKEYISRIGALTGIRLSNTEEKASTLPKRKPGGGRTQIDGGFLERLHLHSLERGREIAIVQHGVRVQKDNLKTLVDFIEKQKAKLARTPSILPVRGRVSSSFGMRLSPFTSQPEFHEGIDIALPMYSPVRVTAEGRVVFSGFEGGYGNLIIVDHGNEIKTYYGHNSKNIVRAGQFVKKGEIIGYGGSTGYSTGSHLHYEVRVGNRPVNPTSFLRGGKNEVLFQKARVYSSRWK